MFAKHMYCSIRDMFLVCHVILQEYAIKGFSDFMGGCQ